jgi:hypothetical protein
MYTKITSRLTSLNMSLATVTITFQTMQTPGIANAAESSTVPQISVDGQSRQIDIPANVFHIFRSGRATVVDGGAPAQLAGISKL